MALVSDVTEMYMQIQMNPEDRAFHHFLWRHLQTDKKPSMYEFQRIIFGTGSSPLLAQCASREIAPMASCELPMASATVMERTYMDDSLDSVENAVLGVHLYNELAELWIYLFTVIYIAHFP